MEVVTAIIGPVVESLLVPIKKHFDFMVFSTNYVGKMGTRMNQLEGTARDVKDHMDANHDNCQMVPHNVPDWLKQVEKLKAEAQSIPPGGIGCFHMKMRYKAGKRSSKILEEIDSLMTQNSEFNWLNQQRPVGKMTSFENPVASAPVHDGSQNTFESRDLIFKEALKSLGPSDKVQKIAICGMGGVGKTTMMEKLMLTVKGMKMFDWVIKANIGQKPNPLAVQKAIADYMGVTLTETDKGARADRLHESFLERIKAEKNRILVILDDLWDEIDLKDIGLPSPLPNGFKLLLTSRDEKVCSLMGVITPFRVEVLKDSEAKVLFWENAGLSNAADRELHEIGEDIATRCRGLPIAIKTIASNLRDNIKDAWKDALDCLEHNDFENLYDLANKVFEISYDNLKKDENKAIFILSGLFPDDFDIPIEDLVRYGWGLKLFNKVFTLERARHRTNTCVYDLIRANLLIQSDRTGYIKMHDLVRGFVVSNVSKFKQASIVKHDKTEWPTEDTRESCKRILLKGTSMYEFPVDFNYPNLALLKVLDGGKLVKFPEDFYKRMKKLEVLAYDRMHIPLLPQYSTTLRTLCLSSCSLTDDFSFLGNLINLEILSFAKCRMRELPSAIGKLVKLKLLDFTGCEGVCVDLGVFQNLANLEELYTRVSGSEVGRFTDARCDELEMVLEGLFAFKKLKRFKISMGCVLEEDNVYSHKNTLKLVTNLNQLRECKVNELFENTEKLYLQVKDMWHLEDVSMHPCQQSFCNLSVLDFFGCEDLRSMFTIPVASSLKKLERLTISSCPMLKELVNGESGNTGSEVIKFEGLKFLDLNDLPNLVSLCDNGAVVELPQLVELRLGRLPKFTSIYSDNYNSAMQPFLHEEVVIPKLEKLKISFMENLKQIWPCQITNSGEVNISMLREIKVSYCERLVNLFPSNPFPLMNHLESLKVKKCDSIEVLFNIDLGCTAKVEQVSSSLRSIRVKELGKLKDVCMVKGGNNSSLLVRGFQSVESIWIYGCTSFRSIFTPTTTNVDIRALVDFSVHRGTQNSSEDNDWNRTFNEALKSLKPTNKIQVIAFCGMGGVGKTTMMEKLKKAAGDLKMFDWVVKVVIGQNENPIAFQQAIAEKTGGPLSETDKDARADRLGKRFAEMSQDGKKKILVILDDLWNVVDLKDIGLASPLPDGFKLLLTSRNQRACQEMGVEANSMFRIDTLHPDEAKILFSGIVGLSEGDDPELHEMGEEIIRFCGFLPIFIKTIASYLRDNKGDAWRDALSHLQLHVSDSDIDIIPRVIFDMSYNNIKKAGDKAVFLLCGLFPDDADIPIEDLMRYVWGLKLYDEVHTIADARHQTNTGVNNLIRANLLMESDRLGCVKMHDLIRDYALSYVSKFKQASILNHDHDMRDWSAPDTRESYERILLKCTGMTEFPAWFEYTNLSFLKLTDGDKLLKFPKNFYKKMKKLEVVAYESIHKPLLPQNSTKLRTLCLHSCSLMDDLSLLRDLINLEILSFANCHIRKLPSAIGKLIKLKLLDLTGCVDLCIDDGVFRKLVNLKELYMRVSGSKVIRFTDANCNELERLSVGLVAIEVEFFQNKAHPKNVSFENLERFKISMGCLLNKDDEYSFTNTLKLATSRSEILECRISDLFEKTEELHFQVNDLNCLQDVSAHPSQHLFCNLRVLNLFKCVDLIYLFTVTMANGLMKLERLTVSSCPVLQSLVHGESPNTGGEVIKFQKLKFISLKELPKLVGFCPADNVVELPQLVELILNDLPYFTSVYPDNNSCDIKPFLNKKVVVANLEDLRIYSMENLTQIWPSRIATTEKYNVSMLRLIEVVGCDSLVNLFPINPLQLLKHLQELQVRNCCSIEVLFNVDFGSVGKVELVRGCLRSIRVWEAEKLREVWRITGANNSEIMSCDFLAVEGIQIESCNRFKDVFTATPLGF